MRKLPVLLLALLMLFSLCACGATEESAQQLLAELQQAHESLNLYAAQRAGEEYHVENALDFRWNEKAEVWIVLPESPSPDDILLADAVGSMCEKNGWTYLKKETDTTAVAMARFIDDAVASGQPGALVFLSIPAGLSAPVQAAADAGIIVLSLDPSCPGATAASIDTPVTLMGADAVTLAEAWVGETDLYTPAEDGEETAAVPVCVNTCREPNTDWSDAVLFSLEASESLCAGPVGGEDSGDSLFDSAYLWARAVLNDLPEARVFLCYAPEAAYGVCYYLEQHAADHALDLADFCVIWNGADGESETYLSVARENASYTAAKGYIAVADDPWHTGALLGSELLGIAYGTALPGLPDEDGKAPDPEDVLDDTFALAAENGVDVPESFPGWEWGRNAYAGIDAHSSFGYDENGLHHHLDVDMASLLP